MRHQSNYFAIAGAIAGITGAMGTACGSFLASIPVAGGLLGLFVVSGLLRMIALIPLLFVQEQRSTPLSHILRVLFPIMQPTELIKAE